MGVASLQSDVSGGVHMGMGQLCVSGVKYVSGVVPMGMVN